MTKIRGFYKI